MRPPRPPDSADVPVHLPRRPARHPAAGVLALVLALVVARPAAGQDWLLINGILDGEAWETDGGSTLLARNAGRPTALGRMYLWSAVQVAPSLQLFALGGFQAGGGEDAEAALEQIAVRFAPVPQLVVDAGKLASQMGTYASRRFSTHNPLIGAPDAYPVLYPWGIQAGGTAGRFDYRAALVSLPFSHEGYLPDPTPAPNFVVGGGVTPATGFRMGTSFTRGPYLNDGLSPALLGGVAWDTYKQSVWAFDLRFSRGYFEFFGEAGLTWNQVPGLADPVFGWAYYGELKYTWSPRLFTAVRLEQNNYAFIRAFGPQWTARATNMLNGEAGVGFRLGARTLAKVSYRRDSWLVDASLRSRLPNGHAVAFQISQSFDVLSWFQGKH